MTERKWSFYFQINKKDPAAKGSTIDIFCSANSISSVQFSHSVTLWPHGLQHARLPCLSPAPRACSNSCPSSQWYHPTISSSVIPFSFCLQSFPASGSFQMSQFFASGGQSTGVSASTSVLPMNKLESRLLGEITITSDTQMTPPSRQKAKKN